MKRLISVLLAASMLSIASPAVSGEGAASLAVDSVAPVTITKDGGTIVLNDTVSAAELLSYFEDSNGLSVRSADGAELTLADRVTGGATVSAGDKSLTVDVFGDVNRDGKINARDVVVLMRGILAGETAPAAADVNIDGSINAGDVTSVMRSLVGYSEPFGENRTYADAGSDAVTLYFDSLMHRIGRSDTMIYGDTTGLIRMAKNEIEDAQMMIVSSEQISGVTVEIGEMKNADGKVLETELFDMYAWGQVLFKKLVIHKVQAADNQVDDYFAEPLPKLVGAVDLGKDESKGVMIQVRTTPETEPGYYSAEVVLKDSEGKELKRTLLRTFVWDFALDEETASDTAFGFDWGATVERKYRNKENFMEIINSPEVAAERPGVYREYMQFLMDNRISPYSLPFDVTSDKADEYMSNPRVTSFCVDGGGQFRGVSQKSDHEILSIYNKLSTNPDWLHKAYVYLVDEPSTLHTHESKLVYDRMSSLLGDTEWHQVTPMGGNDPYDDPYDGKDGMLTDSNEFTYQYADIMCPQSYAFTPFYTRDQRKEAMLSGVELFPPGSYTNAWVDDEIWNLFPKQFQQRYDEWAEKGNRKWWYICESPMLPHPNYFRYYQGAAQRVTLWQQYMFHVDGLLYWHMQFDWEKISMRRPTVNSGDGLLIYWGELFGQSGPVSSIRLEYIRDGIEDFQYMKQLERYMDRDEIIRTYVNRVTTEVLRYSEDPQDIENARVDLGFMLESVSK